MFLKREIIRGEVQEKIHRKLSILKDKLLSKRSTKRVWTRGFTQKGEKKKTLLLVTVELK